MQVAAMGAYDPPAMLGKVAAFDPEDVFLMREPAGFYLEGRNALTGEARRTRAYMSKGRCYELARLPVQEIPWRQVKKKRKSK